MIKMKNRFILVLFVFLLSKASIGAALPADDPRLLTRQSIYMPAYSHIFALETICYIMSSGEMRGGAGTKFFVRFQSDTLVNEPLVEAIMVSTASGQGVSWKSQGREMVE